jgi:AmmeMemoRadiSam system protein B/AmmeMemoRadiSam system protein A
MQILRGRYKRSMVRLRFLFILALIFIYVPNAWPQAKPPAVLKAVVAGAFYPSDKKQLEQKIDTFLKDTESRVPKGAIAPFGLIAPHAGYDYSGKIAAAAYRQIGGKPYKTVFLLGPSHYVSFPGISIYPYGAWETPLGRIPIDEQIAAAIMEQCSFVRYQAPAFEREHSLEVQLPFLQKVLDNFKIVPLVMGKLSGPELRSLADYLTNRVEQNPGRVLIIASSDMSHYHPYHEATAMDKLTLKQVEAMDLRTLRKSMELGTSELCGSQAVTTLMRVAENIGARVKVLEYANSGDVTGDKTRVVGYSAVGFYVADQQFALSEKEQKILLQIARHTLEGQATGNGGSRVDVVAEKLMEKRGVFVTLQKKGMLRGCIGYVKPVQPLAMAVSEMTIAASSHDPRFPAVDLSELKDIRIEISVLSPMKRVREPAEVKVGQHGLYITKGENAGLLLPQVATSNSWSREEFLNQTCLKAGLPSGACKEKDTQIYLFSAQVFSE